MVFYFTGTGNSLYIAKELDANRVSIPQAIKKGELTWEADSIGIVCPIYGHEMPAMMKEFIRRAELKTDYLYVVLTYGEQHGGAAEIAASYLESIGKQAAYINSIKMVDNFLPAFDMEEQVKKDKKIPQHLVAIKADLERRKKMIQKAGLKDKAVHKMYLEMVKGQPETLWSVFKVTDDCIGCGICIKVCPGGCIHLEDQSAVHDSKECQACYACIHACPKLAIQFALPQPEKNPKARYRNEHIQLKEIVAANNQQDQ